MNKKIILALVVLMSFTVIVLFGIQYYWMQNALVLREAAFSRDVNDAMDNVIYRLEKYDIAYLVKRKMYKNKQGKKILNTMDSINQIFQKELDKSKNDSNNISQNIFNVTSEKINVTVLQEHTGEIIKRYDTTIVTIQKRGEQYEMGVEPFSETQPLPINTDSAISKDLQGVINNLNKYLDKTSLVDDVFDDMFNLKHYEAIENRLNFVVLDSLIRQELRNYGILTDYEFGVYSPLRNVMVMEKTGHYHIELLEKGYAFNMFPRDLFMTPEYLMIFFPNKNIYLLTRLWKMIVISLIIILIIAGSFAYTVYIIFRQKRLSEMKNDFINNMTHEFKTPISTISLACEVLQDPEVGKTDDLKNNYIRVIGEENKRLGSMAEKILQTAIIDKGQLKLKKELVNIHQVIEDVLYNTHLQIESKQGKAEMFLQARNYYLKADKTHITNVIYNVIDNAIKYTAIRPLIIVRTSSNAEGISICIEDNGIGISKQNQKRIFESLYRVSTGNIHNVKGFGLGLHYVKTIVEAHKGHVGVESELKKGTKIKIFLPFES
jgi:two-component system phosphate regulon sensor histidine kinase PhoR